MQKVIIVGLALLVLTFAGCGLDGNDTPTTPLSGGNGYGDNVEGSCGGSHVDAAYSSLDGSWYAQRSAVIIYVDAVASIGWVNDGTVTTHFSYTCDGSTATVTYRGQSPVTISWSLSEDILTWDGKTYTRKR